jgi:hypothetical protein
MAILLVAAGPVPAQSTAQPKRDALVDVLVWGAPGDAPAGLDSALASAVADYRRRSEAYQPAELPPSNPEMEMVYNARVSYERRLFAIGTGANLTSLARQYVADLWPCYEWEGSHECPEREALFADSYQHDHPRGPFSRYLPLLSAHRWLCAAEAYKYERAPEGEHASQRNYDDRLKLALASRTPLIRAAAESLKSRGTCFP